MDLPFSIHQELWHDCWLAATAAARSRKRQIDLDVRQRVERLLQDYGPQTSRPLTLRVYGTMIKGFCVINNERARILYADCERVVIMFSQYTSSEDAKALKLPASKKQRVDALTLDLDLARVKEAESFDWTQAPLEEGALLRLQAPEDQLVAVPQAPPEPSLLEQAALLDEAFPPADVPPSVAIDVAAEAARAAEVLARLAGPAVAGQAEAAPAPATPQQQALLPFEPPPQPPAAEEPPRKVARRSMRGLPKLPPPGHLFGFDNCTQLAQEDYDSWQLEEGSLSGRRRQLYEYVALLRDQVLFSEHLGPLRSLLDPCSEDIRAAVASSSANPAGLGLAVRNGGMAAALPEVQELLAGEGVQLEALNSLLGEPPEALASLNSKASSEGGLLFSASALAASRLDPFHPYSPEVPLKATRGAADELIELLGGWHAGQQEPEEGSSPAERAGGDEGGDFAGRELPYDLQTAKIGAVLRRSLERGGAEAGERGVTLDDLIPPRGTDQATAAKTFAAVLVLATAGELCVMQPMPYGPVALSLA